MLMALDYYLRKKPVLLGMIDRLTVVGALWNGKEL
jgi:hypothetical protein